MKKIVYLSVAAFAVINFSNLQAKDAINHEEKKITTKTEDNGAISNLSEFQSFMHKDDKPLIIKFYAPWCPACKAMKPVFAQAAAKYKNQAHFATIDVEKKELKAALELFGIQGIPTIIYKRTGYEDQKAFDTRLQNFLGAAAPKTTGPKALPKKADKKVKTKSTGPTKTIKKAKKN